MINGKILRDHVYIFFDFFKGRNYPDDEEEEIKTDVSIAHDSYFLENGKGKI
jgi:hypothetical protein